MKKKILFNQRIIMLLCLMMVSLCGWGQVTKTSTGVSWNTASDWSPSGVPAANDLVIINTNMATGNNGTRNCGSLTINSGFTLTISNNAIVAVGTGGVTINGSGSVNLGNNNSLLQYSANTTLTYSGSIAKSVGNEWPNTNGPTNVTINNSAGVTLGFNRTVTGLLQTSSTFSVSNTFTLTINGTFQINQGGFGAGPGTWTYGTGATLVYNNSAGPYGAIDANHSYWPATNGPTNVTVQNGGGINMGVARTVSGTFLLVAGTNAIQGTALTLNGTVQINGGNFQTTPNYGSASTLVYNTTYGTSNEWTGGASTSVAAGSGVPANVQVLSGTLTLAGGRGVPGNVTVSNGANLTLNATSGDLYIGGNLSNSGTSWINNGRAVFFVGTGASTITATQNSNTQFFDFLVIQKSSGSVQLSSTDVTINTNNSNFLQLLDAGQLDLNGRSLNLNNAGGNIYTNGSRTITSTGTGGIININGNKAVANNAGTGTLTIGTNITMKLTNASFDCGLSNSNRLTFISGTLQINSGGSIANNPPIYNTGSILNYNSGGSYNVGLEWAGNGTTAGYQVPSTVNITTSGTNVIMPTTTRGLAGDLSIAASTTLTLSSTFGSDFNVAGNFTNSGTFTNSGRLVTFNGGAQSINGNTTTFSFLTLSGSGIKTFGVATTFGTTIISSGVVANLGTFSHTATTLTLGSNGTAAGTWGSTTATTATYKNNTYFAATTGLVTVSTATWSTPTVTITGNTTPYTYSGSQQGPTTSSNTGTGVVTNSYSGTPNSGTFTTGSIRPINAGSYSVTANAAASADGFWASASSSASAFTIGKATPVVTITGNATQYTYSGSQQGPTTSTNTGTGVVSYSYSGTPNTGTFTTGSTLPINAGAYSVTATAAASVDGNWNAASSSASGFIIGKATPVVTITGNATPYTYSGLQQGPTTSTNTGTGVVTYSYSGTPNTGTFTTGSTRPINAGTYSVTANASASADGNWNAASSSASAFTIGKATPVVTITGNATPYTYSGSTQGPTTSSNTGTGVVSYSYSGTPNTGTFTTGATRPVNAGSYSVTATAAASVDGNWNAASSSASAFTIGKATPVVTITGNATPYTYSGLQQGPTTSINTGTGVVTYSYSGTPNTGTFTTGSTLPINAGSYSVTANASASADGNWNAASSSASAFLINTSTLTITANNDSKTYGQTFTTGAGSANFTSSGLQNSETIGTITIACTGAVNTATVGSYTIVPSAATGGTFTASNYSITYTNGTLTVGTAALTITANNQVKCEATSFTFAGTEFTTSGLVNGDAVTTVSLSSTGVGTGAAAGSYTITASSATGTGLSNYTISYSTGTITVTANNTAATPSSTPTLCINTALTAITHTTTGATGIGTATGLPAGVIASFGSNTISISGTPTASGTFNYSIPLTGGCGSINATGTITVNAATIITVPAAPTTQTVYQNTTASNLTVTATGTGTVTYQWFSNATNSNAGGTSLNSGNGAQTASYSPSTTAAGTIYYYVVVTGTCGTATSSAVSVTVVAGNNTWTGNTSSDWNVASNWSLGIVPAGVNDAIIPTVSTYPVLLANTVINNLDLGAGATVTIGSNTLTINGAVTGTGTITGSITSNLTLAGTAGTLHFTSGSTNNYLKNLTLNTGATATLGNALNITDNDGGSTEGSVTVNGTATLTTGGFLTLKSTANGTSRIDQGRTTGGYISGNVTVERFIPKNTYKGWRLLGVNTVGQSIKDAWQEGQTPNGNGNPGYGTLITGIGANAVSAGFDQSSQATSILRYDPVNDALPGLTNTTQQLNANSGYFIYIRGDRSAGQYGGSSSNAVATTSTTLRSTGTVYQGNQSALPAGGIPSGTFALLSNPFASRLDMRNITVGTGLVNAFQVWDPLLTGLYGYGAYQTFTKSGANYVVTPGGGSYGSNGSVQNFIESGAAFFMQSGSSSNNQVTILETSKTAGSKVVNRPAGVLEAKPGFITNLYAVTGSKTNLADGNMIEFDAAYSNAKDILDVTKSYNFGENFGLYSNQTDMVVERRALLTATDTIFYSMYNLKQAAYQLEFRPTELVAAGLEAYLEDSYKGTRTPLDLLNVSTFNFTVEAAAASKASNRFRIVFKPLSGPLPVTFTSIKAKEQGNNIAVEWKVANQINVASYEVEKSTDGRSFNKVVTLMATGISTTYNWLDVNAITGTNYYRIKAIDVNGTVKYTQIVKLILGKAAAVFTISPNPVNGNMFNLQFTNQPAGTYQIRLLNTSGQLVYKNTVQHTGGSSTQSIKLSSELISGVYQLEIIAADKTTHTQKLIIENN